MRARIVLRAAEGAIEHADRRGGRGVVADGGVVAAEVQRAGLEGLATAPRSGRPREIDDAEVQRVLAMTLEPPPDGSTHWSVRRLAAAAGISADDGAPDLA